MRKMTLYLLLSTAFTVGIPVCFLHVLSSVEGLLSLLHHQHCDLKDAADKPGHASLKADASEQILCKD